MLAAAPAAPRALAELRSECLQSRGPRRPLYEILGLQRRQQRRYGQRSNARDPPAERVHAHVSSLLSPFRRLIRSLLVLAGSGDAEPRNVIRGRCQPAAAVVSA